MIRKTSQSCAHPTGEPVILDAASDAGKAYADTVERLLGEERPFRFIEEEKKGFLKRLFGG